MDDDIVRGGEVMDKSFPSALSSQFQIYKRKESSNHQKEPSNFATLIYACFNYMLNGLKLTLNMDNFVVKGKTHQATVAFFEKKASLIPTLSKMYHCYDVIVRVYEFKKAVPNTLRCSLFTVYDDMTNIRVNDTTKEIEIVMKGDEFYLFDKEINFISKRFHARSISQNLPSFSEQDFQHFLTNQKYARDFKFSNLMLYSEIKLNTFGMPEMPLTSKNIVFFYCNTFVSHKRLKVPKKFPMVKKEQFKVLDKWIANKVSEEGSAEGDNDNLYVYTFFCRRTNEFNFVPVELEDVNKSFIDASLKQTKCELIEEQVNFHDHNQSNNDDSHQDQDTCFCPNLHFPLAKSNQAHPNKTIPFMSLVERLSLADGPILDLLTFLAKSSISFYDIETLAKPLSENVELKEPKILKPDSEKYANYVHSIQEAVCIGFQSLCPNFQICQGKWPSNAMDGVDLKSFLKTFFNLSPLKQQEKIESDKLPLESFSRAIKSIIVQKSANPKNLLDSCNVFELGNNSDDEATSFAEPDAISINSMVADFLDEAFKQAEFLSFLKKVLLYPLFEHINKCTSGFKRTGDFAKLANSLRDLSNNFYVFG